MKSNLAILFLFICLACNAQTDSTLYRKVDAQPVLKGKSSIYKSDELADCIVANGPDSSAYKQCVVELVIGLDGKTSNIKLISTLPECYQKIAIKTAEHLLFKPAILKGKPVATLTRIAVNLTNY